jgi:dihydroxy-acid dehydratase
VVIDEAELQARKAAWTAPGPKHERGVLAKYAKLVGSAAYGAVCH